MNIALRNNLKTFGRGKQTMLFAHGFGCDQNMWRFITPAFEEQYTIVLFDYVGCGKSHIGSYNVERYSSLEGYAIDLLEICDYLKLQDILFIGHSVSAMIGIIAGIKKPELFSKLILICPSPRYINDLNYVGGFSLQDIEGLFEVMDHNYLGWASFLAPVIMNNPEQPALTAELQESFCSADPIITRKFAEVTFYSDNREDLTQFTNPCLVLQCTDDAIAPVEVGLYVTEKLLNSTYIKMAATGHCPHLSHPIETIQEIKKFID
ncbi:alpha/beta fold hydrolase [Flavobacterium sp. 7A]|uniref:alpha/beta fold hydrolase n=1 Tax=Flavobacterium sp. 7A TaxID=2940571 RepID=UPI0022268234|nr:alpha/beta hydrolase [Flavobacterium sp. 7A]MCW2120108.1 sigma-B regulation protein RsbQ [Flavobacterium sp. 7A]